MWARVQDPRHNFSSVADELKKKIDLKVLLGPKYTFQIYESFDKV